MPTYEYRCEECGHTFDVVQAFADAPLTTCDVCGGTLRKVYAPVGIVFKGSGFYKTDSRGSGSSRAGTTAKDTGTKDSGTSDGAATSEKATPAAPSTGESTPTKSTAAPAPAAKSTSE